MLRFAALLAASTALPHVHAQVQHGRWYPQLSEPRFDMAATSVADLALFAGGIIGYVPAVQMSSAVDIYDDSTGTWSVATLSVPRSAIRVVSVGTTALFAGGFDANDGASDVVEMFDASTASWTTARLSSARLFMATAAVGSRALFAGGTNLQTGWPTDVVDVYDAATGQWTASTLPGALPGISGTTVGTKAIFCGRASLGAAVFDHATSTWSTLDLPYDTGFGPGAASAGGQAIFAGGFYFPVLYQSTGVDGISIYDDTVGASYCSAAAPNSAGLSSQLRVLGAPARADQAAFVLRVTQLPQGAFGYALASRTQDPGSPVLGSQGTLCLAGAISRFPSASYLSNAAGIVEFPIDPMQMPAPTGAVAISAGETWNFQAWYRDQNPTSTSNFSSAVSVTFD